MTFDSRAHAAYNSQHIVNNDVISEHLKCFCKYIPSNHQPPISQRMDGITWEQFSKEIHVIFEKSKEIGDNWEIFEAVKHPFLLNFFPVKVIEKDFSFLQQNTDTCGTYLRKTAFVELCLHRDAELDDMEFAEEQSLSNDSPPISCGKPVTKSDESRELLSFEYHVLYHLSYAVPYLCFNATKSSKTS